MKNLRRQGCGLPIKTKLLCNLSFMASGSYQRICGKNVNTCLSQPSVSRCVCEVVDALNHPNILRKYIRFPQNYSTVIREGQTKKRFFEKYKTPGVIGCIDGTYVTMVRPSESEESYYCRKENHARNIQLITDADLNIFHVDATYRGEAHDSFIFNHSIIQNHPKALVNAGETVHFLGDSGYAQRAYFMIPVNNVEEGTPATHYNKLHTTASNAVESAIGRLKGRYRCLLVHRVLHYHPKVFFFKILVPPCQRRQCLQYLINYPFIPFLAFLLLFSYYFYISCFLRTNSFYHSSPFIIKSYLPILNCLQMTVFIFEQ